MENYRITLTGADGVELARWNTAEDFGNLEEMVPLMLLAAAIQRSIADRAQRAQGNALTGDNSPVEPLEFLRHFRS